MCLRYLMADEDSMEPKNKTKKKASYLSRPPFIPPSNCVSMSKRWLILAMTASACVPVDESSDAPDSPLFIWLPPPPYPPSPDMESL